MELLNRVTRARVGLIELIGIAIVLAVGVNLVASGIWNWLGAGLSVTVGAAGVILLLVTVALVSFRRMGERVEARGLQVMYANELIEIDDYRLSERTHRALTAALSENKALAKQWQEDPIVFPFDPEESRSDRNNFDGAGARILREALEFVFLDSLSMHLGQYFDADQTMSRYTKEHSREDLLELLPHNRVLDLLTSPLEDRIALIEAEKTEGRHFVRIMKVTETAEGREEKLYMAGDGEYMYTRFELVLPADISVQRVAPGRIRLHGKFMDTELVVRLNGHGYNLDREFLSGYLRLPPKEFYGHGERRGRSFKVSFEFNSQLKWRSLISRRGWKLHRWTEAFANSVVEEFDAGAYFETIQWPTVRTLTRMQQAGPSSREGAKTALGGTSEQNPRSTEGDAATHTDMAAVRSGVLKIIEPDVPEDESVRSVP